jgi:hypothetical protein
VSNQTQPWTFTLDNDNVYWVDAGTLGGVYKVAKTGGAITTLYQGQMGEVESLAVDASSVYFPASGNIVAVPVGGGPARMITSSRVGRGVAVANGRLYWIEPPAAPPAPGAGNSVTSVPVGGGTPTTTPIPGGNPAVSDGAYFTVASADAVYASLMRGPGILRIPLDSSPPTILPVAATAGVAIDSSSVFFASTDTIDMVAKAGGTATHLAPALSAFGVAVDDSFIYVADNDQQQRVLKIAKAGGAVTVLADNQGSPHVVAVDEGYVYWNCIGAGEIKRMAK